jgi:uncharacterized protein (TIRG00374 family)
VRSRPKWTHRLGRGAFLIVTAVSLYLLLPSLVSVFSSWRSLSHLNWSWAGLVLLAECASYVSLWQLNRVALRVDSWFPVACAQLSGNAIGRIVPGGGATASAFAVGMLRRAGIEVGRAATALAASTALQLATTVSLPLLALPAIIGGAPVNKSLITAAYLGIAVLALLLSGGVVAFATDRPLVLVGRGIQDGVNRTFRRRRPAERIPQKLLAERDFIRATLGEHWVAAVLGAAGNTGFDYIALLCALRAVGAQPRPSLVLLAYTTAALLALIPLTPGGLGFVEAGLVGTLTLAGVNPANALVATLVYRLVAFWLPIPVGGGAYLLFRRKYG